MKNTELSIVNQKINIFFLPAQAIAYALANAYAFSNLLKHKG